MEGLDREWREILQELKEHQPLILNRLGRKMMNYLFKRRPRRIQKLMQVFQDRGAGVMHGGNEPAPRINPTLLSEMVDQVFDLAATELSRDELESLLQLWLKSEHSRFLTMAAEKRDVALSEIRGAVSRFMELPDPLRSLSYEERIGVRVALIRRFFSDDLTYLNVLKDRVSVRDFSDILSRVIGPPGGNGQLGGKAAGLFRAEKILKEAIDHSPLLENLTVPRTWYITSDGFLDFIHHNALEEMPTIKYRSVEEIRQEYGYVEQLFKNSVLPPHTMRGLDRVLNDLTDKPLVVRSSSLLEDTHGSAFAGKYKSLFVANRGTKEQRLTALVDAILEVYASVFGPDPIEYRRQRGLLDFNEEMAIMIQEVVGQRVGNYYLPAFAGVAMSYNEFQMSPRIRRTDGIVRLVAGLGTRAVDRVGEDYPVLVSPGQPGLRTAINPLDILRYSQKNIDLINLETGRFETRNFAELIAELGTDYPMLAQTISIYREGHFVDPVSTLFNIGNGVPVITFSNLINKSPFISQIRAIMHILEETLGWPVDLEFAAGPDLRSLFLLQCRPQSQLGRILDISMPLNIPARDTLFTAQRHISAGLLENIEYIVYVDPFQYDMIRTFDELVYIGRLIGELNARLPRRKFILMGPGRWGSRGDIKLGVRVGYSDINNTAMLIEIAREKKGYVPELSFGTHFFQDLIEAKILYLPLYPDESGTLFNEEFFRDSPNCLDKFVTDPRGLDSVVRLIHVPHVTAGGTVSVVLDADREEALAYIVRSTEK